MKTQLARFAAIALLAVAAIAPASAQHRGGSGIELYSEPNFGGDRRYFPDSERNLADRGFNDRALSVKVTGRGTWELCDDHSFGGRCVFIDRSEANLAPLGIAGRVSSFRRVDIDQNSYGGHGSGGGAYGGYGGGFGRPDTRGVGLALFEGVGFSGRSLRMDEQIADFAWKSFNDTAQSLIANGRWVVCEKRDFGGACQVVEGEIHDLNRIGLFNRISSARPAGPQDGGSYHSGNSRPPGYGYGGGVDSGPAAQGRTAGFFPDPRQNGRGVPACFNGRSGDRACAERSADEFCRSAGYREGAYYSLASRRDGEVLEDVLCVR